MEIDFKTKFINERARVLFARYPADNSIAIQLRAINGHEMLCTATVCLKEYSKTPPHGYIFIKDYSENQGMFEALARADIVRNVAFSFEITYPGTTVYEAKLTKKSLDEIEAAGI